MLRSRRQLKQVWQAFKPDFQDQIPPPLFPWAESITALIQSHLVYLGEDIPGSVEHLDRLGVWGGAFKQLTLVGAEDKWKTKVYILIWALLQSQNSERFRAFLAAGLDNADATHTIAEYGWFLTSSLTSQGQLPSDVNLMLEATKAWVTGPLWSDGWQALWLSACTAVSTLTHSSFIYAHRPGRSFAGENRFGALNGSTNQKTEGGQHARNTRGKSKRREKKTRKKRRRRNAPHSKVRHSVSVKLNSPCAVICTDAKQRAESFGNADSAAGRGGTVLQEPKMASQQGDAGDPSCKGNSGGRDCTFMSQKVGSNPRVERRNQLSFPRHPKEAIGEYGDRLVQYITHLEAQEKDPESAAELDQEIEKWLIQPYRIMIEGEKRNLQQRQERLSASCARVSALMDKCEAMITQAVSGFDTTIGGVSKFGPRPVQSAERRHQPEDVISEGEESLTSMQSMVANITLWVKQA